jgi:hypothetical protein
VTYMDSISLQLHGLTCDTVEDGLTGLGSKG